MKLLKALNNPFLLVIEGFVAGAILFFATGSTESQARHPSAPISQAAHR